VRESREDNLRFLEWCVFGRDESHFGSPDARALSPLLVGGGESELEARVLSD
jgi:hypothetical protein